MFCSAEMSKPQLTRQRMLGISGSPMHIYSVDANGDSEDINGERESYF